MFKIKSSTREFIVRDGNEETFFDMCLAVLMKRSFLVQDKKIPEENCDTIDTFSASGNYEVSIGNDVGAPTQKQIPVRQQGVSGFAHLTCEHCGETVTTCLKQKISTFLCPHCGEKTELEEDGIRQVYTDCECGKSARYITNSTEGLFDIPCINCGSPVAVSWNKQKRCYTTIKG
ncbi:hypothetical protein [Anaerotignum sp. MB30-C6]|uniref:hypothetical protein n=1 Tax=Anaerotignum sp. MB30-C6 TaxID=3070814 RepID=UPI0027DBED69|nr:hypothetical protein [Anaerotignum sp. MB30-C6]WMI81930.1 hypothetical protein RBQ60_04150 [Anaerotignum sp. MB30-C6]